MLVAREGGISPPRRPPAIFPAVAPPSSMWRQVGGWRDGGMDATCSTAVILLPRSFRFHLHDDKNARMRRQRQRQRGIAQQHNTADVRGTVIICNASNHPTQGRCSMTTTYLTARQPCAHSTNLPKRTGDPYLTLCKRSGRRKALAAAALPAGFPPSRPPPKLTIRLRMSD
ncbi:hypothetical protein K431DRAFT_119152 [Polychaeton citri CBS 116435]|uniref:Uncharacterized protein n=1 Tax=Polychaeton citri CBS 116435 TaxID=1314669 RepID=A0A9P4Q431_9PEZI|nr:hypothetical protein K431DRAFT_119152 [Polychaeton citri CBS 116435]